MERVRARVTWDDEVIAESDEAVEAGGDVWFPPEDVNLHRIKRPNLDTARTGDQGTAATPLGEAEPLHVVARGDHPEPGPGSSLGTVPGNPDDRYKDWLEEAAWTLPDPEPPHEELAEHVAFAVEDTPLELQRWRSEGRDHDPGEGLGSDGSAEADAAPANPR